MKDERPKMQQTNIRIATILITLLALMSYAYAWSDYAEDNSLSGRNELITHNSNIYEETNFWLVDYNSESAINGTDFNLILDNAIVITKQDFKGKQFKITIPAYNEEWQYSFDKTNWTAAELPYNYSFYPSYTTPCGSVECKSTSNTRNQCSTGCVCPSGTTRLTSCGGSFESCEGDTIIVPKSRVGTINNDCQYPSKELYNIWEPQYGIIHVRKELNGDVNDLTLEVEGKTECTIDDSPHNLTSGTINAGGHFNNSRDNHTIECSITRVASDSSFDVESALVLPVKGDQPIYATDIPGSALTVSLCDIPNYEENETYKQYDNEWLYSFDRFTWTNATPVFDYTYTPERRWFSEYEGRDTRMCNAIRNEVCPSRCNAGCSDCKKAGYSQAFYCYHYAPPEEEYNIWDFHTSIFVKKELSGKVEDLSLNINDEAQCTIDSNLINLTATADVAEYFNESLSNHTIECYIIRKDYDSSFDVESGLTLPRWVKNNCTDIYTVPSNSSGELIVTLFQEEDNLSHVYYNGENISFNSSAWTSPRIAVSGYGIFQNPQWDNEPEPEEIILPEPEQQPEPPKPKSGGGSGKKRTRRPPVYSRPPEPKVNLTVSVAEPPKENISVTNDSTAPPLTPIIEEKVEEITKPKSKSGYLILAGLTLPLIFNGASIYRKIKRSSKGMKVEIPD